VRPRQLLPWKRLDSLLARHGLELHGLDLQDPRDLDPEDLAGIPEETVSEAVLLQRLRIRAWETVLLTAVGNATFTDVLHYRSKTQGKILLIGREINIISAKELFFYLHQVILVAGRAHKGQVLHVDSFRRGMAQRIAQRLTIKNHPESQGIDSKDLVVQMRQLSDRENKGYIKDKFGKTGKKRSGRKVEWGSYQKGLDEGQRVSLDRQIPTQK
jgi:hypothetical protein